jgi:hypothetical protein
MPQYYTLGLAGIVAVPEHTPSHGAANQGGGGSSKQTTKLTPAAPAEQLNTGCHLGRWGIDAAFYSCVGDFIVTFEGRRSGGFTR